MHYATKSLFMNDSSYLQIYTDKAILQEIGTFIKTQRLAQNITQDDMAENAAMSRSTLSLIERGENISLINLIKILRVLGAMHIFEAFQVQPQLSPMKLAKQEAKKRKRASKDHSKTDNNENLGW